MKLPKLPESYIRFLATHDGETEYMFDDIDGWRMYTIDELTEVVRINLEQVPNIYCLRAFAAAVREFHGEETEDQEGKPYSVNRLAAGLAIGDNNGDVVFLDPEDSFSVWLWHCDGADVERLADSFDEWIESAMPDVRSLEDDDDEE